MVAAADTITITTINGPATHLQYEVAGPNRFERRKKLAIERRKKR